MARRLSKFVKIKRRVLKIKKLLVLRGLRKYKRAIKFVCHRRRYRRRQYLLLKPISIALLSLAVGAVFFIDFVNATVGGAGPLEIKFDGDKLFAEENISPGYLIEKQVQVTNNGLVDHSFALAANNIVGNLAENLYITPSVDGSVVWTKSLRELSNLPQESQTILEKVSPGQSKTITLKAEFPQEADNQYQNQQVSFDVNLGTQEPEPIVSGGPLSVLSIARGGPLAVSEAPAEEVAEAAKPSAAGEEQKQPIGWPFGLNKWLLLIVPASAVVALIILSNTWQRNIGVPLVAGAVTYLVAQHSHGDMAAKIFFLILLIEVISASILKLLVKDHHKYHVRRWHQKYISHRKLKKS